MRNYRWLFVTALVAAVCLATPTRDQRLLACGPPNEITHSYFRLGPCFPGQIGYECTYLVGQVTLNCDGTIDSWGEVTDWQEVTSHACEQCQPEWP